VDATDSQPKDQGPEDAKRGNDDDGSGGSDEGLAPSAVELIVGV
jgi:hypothetical protein